MYSGQLGNCWLLSGVACLAEYPGAIEHVFDNLEYNPRGSYSLRLHEITNEVDKHSERGALKTRSVKISVDDRFPYDQDSGQAIFTTPHENELWVMILEKAFAKFMGSYASLEGGHTIFALQTLTGAPCYTLRKDDDGWNCYTIKPKPTSKNPHAFTFQSPRGVEPLKDGKLWKTIEDAFSCNAVLAAGTSGEDKTRTEGRGATKSEVQYSGPLTSLAFLFFLKFRPARFLSPS
jgi:hypothetical protein